jgi:hypothetical protein
MFINGLWFIANCIRTITSVILTLAEKNFTKIRFLLEDVAHPSEGWGWGAVQLQRVNVNKSIMTNNAINGLPCRIAPRNDKIGKDEQSFMGRTSIW